jgi:ketosteroid isomerase-like protein
MPNTMERRDAQDAISELMARYVRSLEQRDWDLWADCFTEDATAQFMPAPGENEAERHRGRAALRGWVEGALRDAYVVIRVSMPSFEFTDDTHARADWAQVERLAFTEGKLREATYYGYYHDSYERGADGEWRISEVRMSRIRHDVVRRDGTAAVNLDIVERLARTS